MTNELGIYTSENNRLVVSSRKVAEVFEKLHKHVMESIRELDCEEEFNESNFRPVEYCDAKGEMRPEYLITRDGFTLLAMGFTGAKAMQFDTTPYDTSKEAHQKPYNDRQKKLTDEVIKLKNIIMLGNAEEALTMLETFVKKGF